MHKIYAGIITYNPDLDKLNANITAILPQVDGLVVVDNGSDNISYIKQLISVDGGNVVLIENKNNKGVAYALNQIMDYSHKSGATWVLTLDDDSECYPGLISMYRKFIESKQVEKLGSVTCLREDRKYVEKNSSGVIKSDNGTDRDCYELVNTCITSGNIVSIEAWKKTKGFNNKLFIDMVDDDFCYRLRAAGYAIARINKVGYLHELGNDIIKVKVFGKEKTVFAYGLKRKYYTARNVRYMIRTYKLGICNEYTSYLVMRILGTILYEKDKLKGLNAYIKGFKAGKKL